MSSFGFSGIASGIDFRSLVTGIIQAESRPINLLEDRMNATRRRVDGWREFQAKLESLRTASRQLSGGDPFRRLSTQVVGGGNAVRATVNGDAAPGLHDVRVHQLARSERLGSRGFQDSASPLGLSGSFRIAGATISVEAEDTLSQLAARINGSGAEASASVLQQGDGTVRLILTSSGTGAAGIDLVDGPQGVLQGLGLLSATTSVRHLRPDGVASSRFGSADAPLSSLAGTGASSGTVRLGNVQVLLDLESQSLREVADAINDASALAGSRVSAIVEEDAEGWSTLVIRGTTDVEEDGGVLEALGVVQRGRPEVARRIEGAALTSGGGVAVASTRLAELDGFDGLPSGTTVGDTLTLTGTRGDGSGFTLTMALDADTTLQDVLDSLNGAQGFGGGERSATATLTGNGRIALQDDLPGASLLDLSMVAHNQGGGTLSPGSFTTAEAGHTVILAAGRDAEAEVDGVWLRSSRNTLDGVIPGLSLQLSEVTAGPVQVRVLQDTQAAVNAVQSLVAAYNEVTTFIQAQAPGVTAAGAARPPLTADGTLRAMQGRLRSALVPGVLLAEGAFQNLSRVGVTVDREGRYQVDAARLQAALTENPAAVADLFSVRARSQAGAVEVLAWTSETGEGRYGVDISAPATRASVTGGPLPGGYPTDATPDRLSVRDLAGGGVYQVSLTGGMTAQAIAEALNQSFGTPTTRALLLPAYRQEGGDAADASTLLTGLRTDGGEPLGIQAGATLTLSGARPSGGSFLQTVVVGSPGAETLGDVVELLRSSLGNSALVSLEEGRIRVQGADPGSSSLDVAISVTTPDDGVLPLGPAELVEAGRGRARLEASAVDGVLSLAHLDFGSSAGFEIVLEGEGVDHTSSLGIAAGTYSGGDVEGTIGGHAATGVGTRLLGSAGSPVSGLSLQVAPGSLGPLGEVEFGRGVGAALERALEELLGGGSGSVPAVMTEAETAIDRLNSRIETMEARLERRRDALIRRFTAMEEAIARAQSQSDWLAAQFRSLAPPPRNS